MGDLQIMTTDTLTCAIIGHLVGDYLLQNDWMATGKKRTSVIDSPHDWQSPLVELLKPCFRWVSFPCLVHCFLWTCSVCLFAGWGPLPWLVLFLTHYLQDRTNIIRWWMTLPWKDQSRFMACDDFDLTDMRVVPGLGPWSVIVVDNVWHIVTILAVWKWIV